MRLSSTILIPAAVTVVTCIPTAEEDRNPRGRPFANAVFARQPVSRLLYGLIPRQGCPNLTLLCPGGICCGYDSPCCGDTCCAEGSVCSGSDGSAPCCVAIGAVSNTCGNPCSVPGDVPCQGVDICCPPDNLCYYDNNNVARCSPLAASSPIATTTPIVTSPATPDSTTYTSPEPRTTTYTDPDSPTTTASHSTTTSTGPVFPTVSPSPQPPAAIIGGAVGGGVVGLAIFSFIVWYYCIRVPSAPIGPPKRPRTPPSDKPPNKSGVVIKPRDPPGSVKPPMTLLYESTPLGPDEIRVLEILPGQRSQVLTGSLSVINISDDLDWDARTPYEALSYVWSQPLDEEFRASLPDPVQLSGYVWIYYPNCPDPVRFPILPNLEVALQHWRHAAEPKKIWTDQICIRQKSPEAPAQVAKMRRVYRRADAVVGWLGEDETGILNLVNKTRTAEQRAAARQPPPVLHFEWQDIVREEYLSINDGDDGVAFLQMAQRIFWRRKWILQEMVLARVPAKLLAGRIEFSWTDMEALGQIIDPGFFERSDDYYVLTNDQGIDSVDNYQNLVRRRIRPFQLLRSQYWNPSLSVGPDYCLLHLVQGLRNWRCERPEDCVFGVAALVPEAEAALNSKEASASAIAEHLAAVYADPKLVDDMVSQLGDVFESPKWKKTDPRESIPEAVCNMIEVYGRLIKTYVDKHRRLDGLNFHDGHPMPFLPSWMPNFYANKRRFSLIEGVPDPRRWLSLKDPVFCASGKKFQPIFKRLEETHGRLAAVWGFRVEKIRKTAKPFKCSAETRIADIPSVLQGWAERAGREIGQWGTGVYGDEEYFDRVIRYTSVGGLSTLRQVVMPHRVNMEELYSVPTPPGRTGLHHMAVVHEHAVFRAQHGRVLFHTDDGRIGLGPASMREGDQLWILFGGQTPYILRPTDKEEVWEFVGECYVHSLMDGEAVEALKTPVVIRLK